MNDAFVYDAVRTPFGKFNGGLAGVRPDDLAAVVLGAVRDRTQQQLALAADQLGRRQLPLFFQLRDKAC